MALSYEEMIKDMGRMQTTATFSAEERVHQLKSLQQEALQVSNLIADPNWEIFCRHAERLAREKERIAATIKARLDSRIWEPTEYANMKMDFTKAECTANGIKIALEIAKTIVEQGEKAASELGVE